MSTKARLIANLASGNTFSNAIATYLTANVIAGDFPALGGDLTNTEGSTTISLATSGVAAGSYGNTTAIPVITVDAKGRITSATTNSVSSSAGVTGVTWTAANSTVTVSTSTAAFSANIQAANATVQGLTTVLDSVTNTSITIAASANSVTNAYDRAIDANTRAYSAQTAASDAYSNAVSYAASNTYVNTTFAPKAGPTFTGTAAFADVTISGNLTTSGTTTYINTTNLTVGDNIITLNADLGAVAPTENAGIEVNRGTSANVALRWYEAGDEWQTTVDGTSYLKVATNNDVSTAYSNAIAYSGNAALAYANAISTAATDASTKADTAYSNAITYAAANSYVNTQLGLKASLSGATFSGAVSGITTLAAGNTTITGFANVSSTITGTQLISTVATGTKPLSVTSTTLNDNLNADLLDGQHGSYYLDWTNTTNKPDPVITVTLTGGITGTANTTLTDLASGTVTVATAIGDSQVTTAKINNGAVTETKLDTTLNNQLARKGTAIALSIALG